MEEIRMYAVIFERKPIYLGTEPGKAIDVFNSTAGSELHKIESLEQLSGLVEENPKNFQVQDQLSEAAQRLVQKLDELGINQDLAEKVYQNSEKVIAEVRYIGVRGMKAVGEGFIALGDLLKKAGDEQAHEEENNWKQESQENNW
jgi:hypothetical protein